MKPLSAGNVVSAGLRIYRDNFKKYYRLAFIGALWSWIPIYGWAKFYAMQGLVSRLAYSEIAEQPEAIRDAERHIQGRSWSFLGAAFLVGLRFIGIYILGAIVLAFGLGMIIVALSAGLSAVFGNAGTTIASIISILLGIAGFAVYVGFLVRLLAKYFVSELSLAIEDNRDAALALERSKELTQGYVVKVMVIFTIAGLISLPIFGLILTLQLLPAYLQGVLNLPVSQSVFTIIQFIFNTITTALIVPFWQAIKSVIYYDLRVRREGMGIDLRK